MPKMKSNKSASKRFKKTGTGKIMYRSSRSRHILTNKSAKRKRRLGKSNVLAKGDTKRVNVMLPYL